VSVSGQSSKVFFTQLITRVFQKRWSVKRAGVWSQGRVVRMAGSPRLDRIETPLPASYHHVVVRYRLDVFERCPATTWWTMPGSVRQSIRSRRG